MLTVTSLEHELRDHSVEWRLFVSVTLLPGAQSSEVGGSLWHDIVPEGEGDGSKRRSVCRDLEEDVCHFRSYDGVFTREKTC